MKRMSGFKSPHLGFQEKPIICMHAHFAFSFTFPFSFGKYCIFENVHVFVLLKMANH